MSLRPWGSTDVISNGKRPGDGKMCPPQVLIAVRAQGSTLLDGESLGDAIFVPNDEAMGLVGECHCKLFYNKILRHLSRQGRCIGCEGGA